MHPIISDAKLMEIAEAVDNGMAPGLAVRHFGLSKSTIYRALRHFENVTGKKLIGPSVAEKSRMKKARLAANGGAVPKPRNYAAEHKRRKAHRTNGTGTALSPIADDWQRRALEAERRAHDLSDQLEHATDEAHTLQKIIITLGRAL